MQKRRWDRLLAGIGRVSPSAPFVGTPLRVRRRCPPRAVRWFGAAHGALRTARRRPRAGPAGERGDGNGNPITTSALANHSSSRLPAFAVVTIGVGVGGVMNPELDANPDTVPRTPRPAEGAHLGSATGVSPSLGLTDMQALWILQRNSTVSSLHENDQHSGSGAAI